jgi:hypothetical protein
MEAIESAIGSRLPYVVLHGAARAQPHGQIVTGLLPGRAHGRWVARYSLGDYKAANSADSRQELLPRLAVEGYSVSRSGDSGGGNVLVILGRIFGDQVRHRGRLERRPTRTCACGAILMRLPLRPRRPSPSWCCGESRAWPSRPSPRASPGPPWPRTPRPVPCVTPWRR